MVVRLVLRKKTAGPKAFTLLGIVIEESLLQREKAASPMYVTLLPMMTVESLVHSLKVHSSMDVTPSPMMAEVRLLQLGICKPLYFNYLRVKR